MRGSPIAAFVTVIALGGCAPPGMYYPMFSLTPVPIPRSEEAQGPGTPDRFGLTPEQEAREDAQYPDCVPIHRPGDPVDAGYFELRHQCIQARKAEEARVRPGGAPSQYGGMSAQGGEAE